MWIGDMIGSAYNQVLFGKIDTSLQLIKAFYTEQIKTDEC